MVFVKLLQKLDDFVVSEKFITMEVQIPFIALVHPTCISIIEINKFIDYFRSWRLDKEKSLEFKEILNSYYIIQPKYDLFDKRTEIQIVVDAQIQVAQEVQDEIIQQNRKKQIDDQQINEKHNLLIIRQESSLVIHLIDKRKVIYEYHSDQILESFQLSKNRLFILDQSQKLCVLYLQMTTNKCKRIKLSYIDLGLSVRQNLMKCFGNYIFGRDKFALIHEEDDKVKSTQLFEQIVPEQLNITQNDIRYCRINDSWLIAFDRYIVSMNYDQIRPIKADRQICCVCISPFYYKSYIEDKLNQGQGPKEVYHRIFVTQYYTQNGNKLEFYKYFEGFQNMQLLQFEITNLNFEMRNIQFLDYYSLIYQDIIGQIGIIQTKIEDFGFPLY
ncbi:hypothetical protein pb186bvf_010500 [Paramecium bursaria]